MVGWQQIMVGITEEMLRQITDAQLEQVGHVNMKNILGDNVMCKVGKGVKTRSFTPTVMREIISCVFHIKKNT